MPNQCELLDKCGFFLKFTTNQEVIKQRWVTLYCEDKGTSELCKRKIIRLSTGEPPADNMAPTGRLL